MKKLTALALALIMALILSACGEDNENGGTLPGNGMQQNGGGTPGVGATMPIETEASAPAETNGNGNSGTAEIASYYTDGKIRIKLSPGNAGGTTMVEIRQAGDDDFIEGYHYATRVDVNYTATGTMNMSFMSFNTQRYYPQDGDIPPWESTDISATPSSLTYKISYKVNDEEIHTQTYVLPCVTESVYKAIN